MNDQEYKNFARTGSIEPDRRRSTEYVDTKSNCPKNTMKGYHSTTIKVVRGDKTVKTKDVSFLVLELINDRSKSDAFRRMIAR